MSFYIEGRKWNYEPQELEIAQKAIKKDNNVACNSYLYDLLCFILGVVIVWKLNRT